MISVTILVKNGQRHLQKVLHALTNFPEIVIIDTGSTDQTQAIATSFPQVKFFKKELLGFGPTHNLAAELASFDWILSLDADEVLSQPLAQEILSLSLDPHNVYSLFFHNYALGQWIRHSGWFPETHVRLYHKKTTSFCNSYVHEKIITDKLNCIQLQHPVHHYSYDSIDDFLRKAQLYSTLFAQQQLTKSSSSTFKAVIHALTAFFKIYFLKQGFKDGALGLIIAWSQAQTTFYKYMKLLYAQKTHHINVSQDRNR